MLIISKSVVAGTAEKDTLLVIKTKAGTAVEAIEANTTVLKSYDDAVAIYALPVSKAKDEKKLKEGQHHTAPKGYPTRRSAYAVPDYWEFPLEGNTPTETDKRIRAAIAYFSKHPWHADEHKAEAARRILHAAKEHGIHVSKDSDVYRAAHK